MSMIDEQDRAQQMTAGEAAPLADLESQRIAQTQEDVLLLEDYLLRRLLFAEPDYQKLVFGAGGLAEQTLPGDQADPYNGVFVFNPNPIAVNVAFGSGVSQLGLAVPAYSWQVLPQRFTAITVGLVNLADAAGTAYTITIGRLRVPPTPSAGAMGTGTSGTPGAALPARATLMGGTDGGAVLRSFLLDTDGAQMMKPGAVPSAKGKTHNAVAIAAGATARADLVTTGYRRLILIARMTAGASGDLVLFANPYEDDGTPYFVNGIPSYQTVSNGFSGGIASSIKVFELHGMEKLSVAIQNANAAGQTATCVYYLQR